MKKITNFALFNVQQAATSLLQVSSGILRFAEHALKDINKPLGVSQYQLTSAIPDHLKGSFPTIKKLEKELSKTKFHKRSKLRH